MTHTRDKFNLYVFDINGTLSNLTHRLHFIKRENPDYDSFFNAVMQDSPVLHTINLLNK